MSVEKLAGLDMDLMARMRILEGAFDLPKWSMSRNSQTIRASLKEFPVQHPEIHPSWFAIQDFRLYEAVLGGAYAVLKAETGENTAQEIAQSMAAGLSAKTLEVRRDVYGEVGENKAKGIMSGNLEPKHVKGLLFAFAKRRALDTWRKARKTWRKDRQEGPTEVHMETQEQTIPVSSDVALDRSPMAVWLSLMSSPMANKFKNWIYQTVKQMRNPIYLAVLEAKLDKPEMTNAELGSAPEVVAVTGRPVTGQMAGKYWKDMIQVVMEKMKGNPQVTDWMDRYLDLAQLGYGGGSLRMAKRVASRYLQGSLEQPIPAHLEKFPWYARHQAWLASQGKPHHDFPEGTVPKRADLRRDSFQGANLKKANLQGAVLILTDFEGANLQEAVLQEADLHYANLKWADLSRANLRKADLQGAFIEGAIFIGADLLGANLPNRL